MNKADKGPDFTDFLVTAVHDMKNTLHLFSQRIELLLDDPLPERSKQQLNALYRESNQLHASLINLLSLYRVEHQQLAITTEEIFIAELIEEQLCQLNIHPNIEPITVTNRVESELTALGDPVLIGYVLNNALLNALRFCHHQILIQAYQADEGVFIEICDDGSGFPQSTLDRSHTPTQGLGQYHCGLGLWLARKIMDTHQHKQTHGKIELTNGGELKGAIFRLFLP
ncbi:sensor histidine kinase [Dongshaea marina]|uniref:sensor histidine kinase n=1 Tax=Dongshaea marina TaxID=2047966 RepID=UPI00131F1043|nr:HAMP domain-containing sensor histidine kinase [Dongshaea marina]